MKKEEYNRVLKQIRVLVALQLNGARFILQQENNSKYIFYLCRGYLEQIEHDFASRML